MVDVYKKKFFYKIKEFFVIFIFILLMTMTVFDWSMSFIIILEPIKSLSWSLISQATALYMTISMIWSFFIVRDLWRRVLIIFNMMIWIILGFYLVSMST